MISQRETELRQKAEVERQRAITAERAQTIFREQAELDRLNAQKEAAKSRQVAQFLKDMLGSVGPSVAVGRDKTLLREILDRTAARLGRDLSDQPEVELELEQAIEPVFFDLGEFERAEALQRRVVVLEEQLFGPENSAVAYAIDVLANVLWQEHKHEEAEALHRKALSVRRKTLGNDDPAVAWSLNDLATTLSAEGKLAPKPKRLTGRPWRFLLRY